MDISFNTISTGISRLLHRYHILLFSIVVLGAVIVAILLLNQVLTNSDQADGYAATTNSATFDTATINRINALHTINEPSVALNLSHSTRLNPFTEQ